MCNAESSVHTCMLVRTKDVSVRMPESCNEVERQTVASFRCTSLYHNYVTSPGDPIFSPSSAKSYIISHKAGRKSPVAGHTYIRHGFFCDCISSLFVHLSSHQDDHLTTNIAIQQFICSSVQPSIQILCFWTFSIVLSLFKNTVLFILQNTSFRTLESVSVFR
jgi:hypothetical protein